MSKKFLLLLLIASFSLFYFLTSNNSGVLAQAQCVTRPTGSPPNQLGVVQEVAAQFPEYLSNSCQEQGGTWQFMDEVVRRLNAKDPRFGFNCKRGNCNDPSHDAISYYYGPAPVPPTGIRAYEVFVLDIIAGHCGSNPQPAWQNMTQPGGALGGYLYPRTPGNSLPSANWCSGSGGPAPQPPGPAPQPPGPAPAPQPGSQQQPPKILFADPNTVKPGQKLKIIGTDLTNDVRIESTDGQFNQEFTASLNSQRTNAEITLPAQIPPGQYFVMVIGQAGNDTLSNAFTVTQEPAQPEPPPEPGDFGELVESIFWWALRLVGLAVFVNFLYAGFLWFTAAGRPSQIKSAQEKMWNSLIGAIILLAAYLILNTINPDLVRGVFKLSGIQQGTTQSGGGTNTGPPFGGGTGSAACVTIPSNYTYTPPSSCELPYKEGALLKNETALFAECREALWTIRNTNTALGCSRDFIYRGIPASIWEGWKNNEAQRVLDACQNICNPDPNDPTGCPQGFPASVDKDKILEALQPYWNLCIEGQRKGISCVCTPNASVCRRPINFTALIQRQCPANTTSSSRSLPITSETSSTTTKRETFATAYGYLDGISPDGNYIEGWAYNPVTPNQPNYVYLHIDDGESGKFIKIPTLINRPDVNAAKGISGKHGFVYPIAKLPDNFKDGRNYYLRAYVDFGKNRLLDNGPINLAADIIRNAEEPNDSKYDSLITRIPYNDDIDASLKQAEDAGLIIDEYSKASEKGRKYYTIQSPDTDRILMTIGVHGLIAISSPLQNFDQLGLLCEDGPANVLVFRNRIHNIKKLRNTVRIRGNSNPNVNEGIKKAIDYLKTIFPATDSKNWNIPGFTLDESALTEDVSFISTDFTPYPGYVMLVRHFEYILSNGSNGEHTNIIMDRPQLFSLNSDQIMRIAVHEMAHALGLGHDENDPGSLLYNYIDLEKNNLFSADHINAIRDIHNPSETKTLTDCRFPISSLLFGASGAGQGNTSGVKTQEGFNPYTWYDFLWRSTGGGGQTGETAATCWIIPGVQKCPAF